MYKKIDLSDYRTVAKNFDKRMAGRSGLPIWLRIAHAAGAEMNRKGHAEFGGWLNLAHYITVDGEKIPSRSKIYEGVKKAIEFGYLTQESDVVCLVQSGYDTQKAAHAGYGCKHHDIKTPAESLEVLAGEIEESINYETGEIMEPESPVSPSEELVVSEEPVVIPAPENPIVGQDEAPESPEEKVAKDLEAQMWTDYDPFDEKETEPVTNWFDELDGMEKDVAAFAMHHRRADGVDRIRAVAHEASKTEYDEWGDNLNMRYTYAGFNVDVPACNDNVTDMMEEAW
jgi:hypothetical protein